MIDNTESVARALFSPRMIYNGELQPEAFQLRQSIAEEYLSVVRMSIDTWKEDILMIPQRKNRPLYGYTEMSVEEIRNARFGEVEFDVKACDNSTMKSHAGIFITVGGEKLKAGQHLSTSEDDVSQDFLLLAIQRKLVEIARKGLHSISTD